MFLFPPHIKIIILNLAVSRPNSDMLHMNYSQYYMSAFG